MVTTIDKLQISMLYKRAIQKIPYITCYYFMKFPQIYRSRQWIAWKLNSELTITGKRILLSDGNSVKLDFRLYNLVNLFLKVLNYIFKYKCYGMQIILKKVDIPIRLGDMIVSVCVNTYYVYFHNKII